MAKTSEKHSIRVFEHVPVLHPPLFALLPVLGLYSQNATWMSWHALTRPGLVLVIGALALWVVLRILARNTQRAGFVASILIFAAFPGWRLVEYGIQLIHARLEGAPEGLLLGGFGAVVVAYAGYRAFRGPDGAPRGRRLIGTLLASAVAGVAAKLVLEPACGPEGWILALYLLIVLFASVRAWQTKLDLDRVTRAGNWFAALLALLFMANGALQTHSRTSCAPPPLAVSASESAEKPDIYCLVLDGYGREDVLRQALAFNNNAFLERMAGLGFTIVANSTANYSVPLTSLASCLNMDYMDALAPAATLAAATPLEAADFLHANRLFALVRAQGYTVTAFSPGIEIREPLAEVDACLAPRLSLRESELVILNSTALRRLMEIADYVSPGNTGWWAYAPLRRRIPYAFTELTDLAAQAPGAPRLVWAHLSVPDPPFLFDRYGGWPAAFEAAATLDQAFRGTGRDFVEYYGGQIAYTNAQILKTVEGVIAQAKRPSVILVFSPAGPALPSTEETRAKVAPYRLANLLMVRFPHEGPALDTSMTLVNLFREVLNRSLGTNLPLLPNKWYLCSEDRPLDATPTAPPPKNR